MLKQQLSIEVTIASLLYLACLLRHVDLGLNSHFNDCGGSQSRCDIWGGGGGKMRRMAELVHTNAGLRVENRDSDNTNEKSSLRTPYN